MILRGLRHCQYNPGALDDLPPKNQHYQEDSEEADEYDDPGWIMDKCNHAMMTTWASTIRVTLSTIT